MQRHSPMTSQRVPAGGASHAGAESFAEVDHAPTCRRENYGNQHCECRSPSSPDAYPALRQRHPIKSSSAKIETPNSGKPRPVRVPITTNVLGDIQCDLLGVSPGTYGDVTPPIELASVARGPAPRLHGQCPVPLSRVFCLDRSWHRQPSSSRFCVTSRLSGSPSRREGSKRQSKRPGIAPGPPHFTSPDVWIRSPFRRRHPASGACRSSSSAVRRPSPRW